MTHPCTCKAGSAWQFNVLNGDALARSALVFDYSALDGGVQDGDALDGDALNGGALKGGAHRIVAVFKRNNL